MSPIVTAFGERCKHSEIPDYSEFSMDARHNRDLAAEKSIDLGSREIPTRIVSRVHAATIEIFDDHAKCPRARVHTYTHKSEVI